MIDSAAPPSTVLLFREQKPDDRYVAALAAAGRRAVCIPVLGFDCSLRQDELCRALCGLATEEKRYSGIILTSQRAVAALTLALLDGAGTGGRDRAAARAALAAFASQVAEVSEIRPSSSVYVVGKQTADAFRAFAARLVGCVGKRRHGGTRGGEGCGEGEGGGAGDAETEAEDVLRKDLLRGADSGRATELARVIVADHAAGAAASTSIGRKLLYLCGESRRDELPTALDAAGVAWDSVKVYKSTRLGSNLNLGKVKLAAKRGAVSAAVFFSPSGVNSVCENDELRALLGGGKGGEGEPRPLLVGIGATTSEALSSSALCRAGAAAAGAAAPGAGGGGAGGGASGGGAGGGASGGDGGGIGCGDDGGGGGGGGGTGHGSSKRVVTSMVPTPAGVVAAVSQI